MICLDGFNTFFQPSDYPSFRYVNNKHFKGFIPPYDIALCRLLMKFDGLFMRNGVKVAATIHKWWKKTFQMSWIGYLTIKRTKRTIGSSYKSDFLSGSECKPFLALQAADGVAIAAIGHVIAGCAI